jgi:predicted dienelactone hydrolase
MTRRWPVLCGLLLAGCGGGDDAPPADEQPPELLPAREATAPAEPGPYQVGVTTMEVDDGTGRILPVEIWYPAVPDADAPVEIYKLVVGALVVTEDPSKLGAVRDAPLDLRGAPHPTVVFSHGFGATRLQSLYLTEHLASHGFVVAAPDHIGNTIRELIDTSSADTALVSAFKRPNDVSRTLDAILERSDGWPDDPLAFAVDPDRVGVAGHSFGGFTTFRIAGATIDAAFAETFCSENPDDRFCDGWPPSEPIEESQVDPRFRAALPQTPGGAGAFNGGGFASIAVPTMIQAGTLDSTTPYDEEAVAPFDALTGDAWLWTLEDAGHFTFSDMCRLIGQIGLTPEEFDDGCSDVNIPAEQAHVIIRRDSTAFLRQYVAGDDRDAALLDDVDAAPISILSK